MKTYENNPHKRKVQQLLYKEIEPFFSSALVLLGPTPSEEYLSLIRSKINKNNIINYEIDKDIILPYQKDIVTIYSNVINSFYQRLIDLDLMKTIKSERILLVKLFRQQELFLPYNSNFMFTVSMRSITDKMMITFFEYLLNCNITLEKKKVETGITEWILRPDNTKYTIHSYMYAERCKDNNHFGIRMLNTLIQY